MDVSIIIVNYNTRQLLLDCISSIYRQTIGITFEIIVSDNGSVDGSIAMLKKNYPDVKIVENFNNIGFGAANNNGLKIAQGKYVFYLNSDTLLLNNAIKYFVDFWENYNFNDLGALGSNLLDIDKRIIHSWGKFPTLISSIRKLVRRYIALSYKGIKEKYFNISSKNIIKEESFYIGEVDYITGADLFMLNDKNALFDERFFLYSEETDLEYRLSQKRKKRIIIKGPKIMHLIGGSNSIDNCSICDQYASFSKIQMDISHLRFFTYHKSKYEKYIIKFLIKLNWKHPLVRKQTKKYLNELNSIF